MSKLKKQKTGKKILLNLLYICLTIGVIVVIGFLDPSVTDFFFAIGSLRIGWVIAAAGACLINFLFEGIAVHNIMRFVHPDFSLGKSINNAVFIRRTACTGCLYEKGRRFRRHQYKHILH